jgi:nitrate/nitrite transporter NarK
VCLNSLATWFPLYFTQFHNMESLPALLLSGAFATVSALSRAAARQLGPRVGGETLTLSASSLVALGATLLTASDGPSLLALAIVGLVCVAVGMGVMCAGVFALGSRAAPGHPGAASGWIGGLGATNGFLVAPILGALVDGLGDTGYQAGFAYFIALSVVNAGLVLVFRRARQAPGEHKSQGDRVESIGTTNDESGSDRPPPVLKKNTHIALGDARPVASLMHIDDLEDSHVNLTAGLL